MASSASKTPLLRSVAVSIRNSYEFVVFFIHFFRLGLKQSEKCYVNFICSFDRLKNVVHEWGFTYINYA